MTLPDQSDDPMTTETARMFYERALKAEATVERQAKYIEAMPYPSDLTSLESNLAHIAGEVRWVLKHGELGKQSRRRLREAMDLCGLLTEEERGSLASDEAAA